MVATSLLFAEFGTSILEPDLKPCTYLQRTRVVAIESEIG